MEQYTLQLTLKSDATFGRGDGVPGLVDQEVEHDDYGLPFLRAKTLKGLLVEECANLLYALDSMKQPALVHKYWTAATKLFGQPSSRNEVPTVLRLGDACLPDDLQQVIRQEIASGNLTPDQVLNALTDIRRQTAMDETGKPDPHSLRATRVTLRETVFIAPLYLEPNNSIEPISDDDRALLAACVKALRRAGTNRNRGSGCLETALLSADGQPADTLYSLFTKEVAGI